MTRTFRRTHKTKPHSLVHGKQTLRRDCQQRARGGRDPHGPPTGRRAPTTEVSAARQRDAASQPCEPGVAQTPPTRMLRERASLHTSPSGEHGRGDPRRTSARRIRRGKGGGTRTRCARRSASDGQAAARTGRRGGVRGHISCTGSTWRDPPPAGPNGQHTGKGDTCSTRQANVQTPTAGTTLAAEAPKLSGGPGRGPGRAGREEDHPPQQGGAAGLHSASRPAGRREEHVRGPPPQRQALGLMQTACQGQRRPGPRRDSAEEPRHPHPAEDGGATGTPPAAVTAAGGQDTQGSPRAPHGASSCPHKPERPQAVDTAAGRAGDELDSVSCPGPPRPSAETLTQRVPTSGRGFPATALNLEGEDLAPQFPPASTPARGLLQLARP